MKRYLKFMAFAMSAVFSLAFVSCSSDDDNDGEGKGNSSSKKDYSYTINDIPFYYGKDYFWGASTVCSSELHLGTSDADYDWAMLFIHGYDTPLQDFDQQVDEDGNWVEHEYEYSIEGVLNLKKFNPKTKKKGDTLEVLQNVKSYRTDTDDPKYLMDFENYVYVHSGNLKKRYTWRGKYQGSIKFVSYTDNILTLEFDHVKMEVYQGSDYSSHPYKAATITINGQIMVK